MLMLVKCDGKQTTGSRTEVPSSNSINQHLTILQEILASEPRRRSAGVNCTAESCMLYVMNCRKNATHIALAGQLIN